MSGAKSRRILAVDPGTTHSGWCIFEGGAVVAAGIGPNGGGTESVAELVSARNNGGPLCDVLAVEMVASYGMAVGAEVFETCVWIGRFLEMWGDDDTSRRVYRKDVKLHLCGNARAKDTNIRQALIDRWGGKAAAIGTSKKPGPLYGVKSHAWAALAVAVTVSDGLTVREGV